MRERTGKKHLRKKNIEPIFGEVNEGDEIKTSEKNIAGKIFFISQNELAFFRNVFLSTEIDCFLEIGNNLMRVLGRKKKHMFFFGNARPKSDARSS